MDRLQFYAGILLAMALAGEIGVPAQTPRRPKPIAEPEGSIGYRVNVVSPLEKIFQNDDYAPTVKADKIDLAAARNEYESAQVVIEAPWRPVTIKDVRCTDLTGPGNASIPASAIRWERVDYIETTVKPPYPALRGLGRYPDPLVPTGKFAVDKLSRVPVWITLKTPRECPAGEYRGRVTIVPDGFRSTVIPLSLKVWDFSLTDQTHLRTLTWLGEGALNDLLAKAEAAGMAGSAIDGARRLLSIDELVKETGAYDTNPGDYIAYRARMAEAITGLKDLVEKTGVGRVE